MAKLNGPLFTATAKFCSHELLNSSRPFPVMKDSLQDLRREIDQLDGDSESLVSLIAELEREVSELSSTEQPDPDLVEALRETTLRLQRRVAMREEEDANSFWDQAVINLEAKHPRVASLLTQLNHSLASIGV